MLLIRQSLRSLLRTPGSLLASIAMLTVAIALVTSMFSLLNRLLLRPLPYPDSERLVRVHGTSPQSTSLRLAAAYAADVISTRPEPRQWATFQFWGATLTEPAGPAELLVSLRCSDNFLTLIGVQPLLGRWFAPREDGEDSRLVVISRELWERRLGASPDIIGRTLHIDKEPWTVIGVMPESIQDSATFGRVDLWRPAALTATERANRMEKNMELLTRLNPGESVEQLNADLDRVALDLARKHPNQHSNERLRAVKLKVSGIEREAERLSLLALGLAFLVLAIACINMANFQLARGVSRLRDLGIQAALGADRARLMAPLLVENLMIAFTGGALGLLVALGLNRWMGAQLVFHFSAPGHDIPLAPGIAALSLAVALGCGACCGLFVGWLLTRQSLHVLLKDQSRGSSGGRLQKRLGFLLVVGEYAFALALGSATVLLAVGIHRQSQDPQGWNPAGLGYGYIALPDGSYKTDGQVIRFYEEAVREARAIPGVEQASFGWQIPILNYHSIRQTGAKSSAATGQVDGPLAYFNGVMPDFFETLEIPLVEGRDFGRADSADSIPVAIVNETLAKALWPRESALGQRLDDGSGQNRWRLVVGVVKDVRFPGNVAAPGTTHQVYVPFAQEPWRFGALIARTRAMPGQLTSSLRTVVSRLDNDVALFQPASAEGEIARRLSNLRLVGRTLCLVALAGFLLSALGLYVVTHHGVLQRRRDIGIRMALGASPGAILRWVLAMGLRQIVVGLAAGALLSLWLVELIEASLPSMPSPGAICIVATALALAATGLLSCLPSALRGSRMSPLSCLSDSGN